jgi:hypothetical protein
MGRFGTDYLLLEMYNVEVICVICPTQGKLQSDGVGGNPTAF